MFSGQSLGSVCRALSNLPLSSFQTTQGAPPPPPTCVPNYTLHIYHSGNPRGKQGPGSLPLETTQSHIPKSSWLPQIWLLETKVGRALSKNRTTNCLKAGREMGKYIEKKKRKQITQNYVYFRSNYYLASHLQKLTLPKIFVHLV